MMPWFRLTLICCLLLCLFLGLTQAVDCNYQPVVSSGSSSDRGTKATSDSPTSAVVGSMAFHLARAGPFGSLGLDCGLTAGNIGPPDQENHGPPKPTGPWQVAGQPGDSNQRHRATLSTKLLIFSRTIEESGFRNSLQLESCDAAGLPQRLKQSRHPTTLFDVLASFGIRDEHNTGAVPRVFSRRGRRGSI
jgi:hypothetical protein